MVVIEINLRILTDFRVFTPLITRRWFLVWRASICFCVCIYVWMDARICTYIRRSRVHPSIIIAPKLGTFQMDPTTRNDDFLKKVSNEFD
jgi:hypothetical protein